MLRIFGCMKRISTIAVRDGIKYPKEIVQYRITTWSRGSRFIFAYLSPDWQALSEARIEEVNTLHGSICRITIKPI